MSLQMSENEVLEPSTLVSTVDKQRIQVLTRSTPTPNLQGRHQVTRYLVFLQFALFSLNNYYIISVVSRMELLRLWYETETNFHTG